jgi:hypothetical protein
VSSIDNQVTAALAAIARNTDHIAEVLERMAGSASGPSASKHVSLGPKARKARAALAQASKNGADAAEVDYLRREFRRARAIEQIAAAEAELAELAEPEDAYVLAGEEAGR